MKPATQKMLAVPSVPRVRYNRNFIQTAVCELRFPTILEIEQTPPHAFQAKIRKAYPNYEARTMEVPGGLPIEHHYLFRTADNKWTIIVKSSSIGLETSSYTDFADFFGRLETVLGHATDMVDSNFFTRVGLRYINALPLESDSPVGWVNSQLLSPLLGGALGETKNYRAQLQGEIEDGHYSLRHGISKNEAGDVRRYYLDFDFFQENVEVENVLPLLKRFNEQNFFFFSWCLDEKATTYLGEGRPK